MTTTNDRDVAAASVASLPITDGVYELHYRYNGPQDESADSLLLIMRNGQLLGADKWGGLISGQCRFDQLSGRHHFNVMFDAPSQGLLVTGDAPPREAQSIELVTDIADSGKAVGTVDLFGESVRLELDYCGPLPVPPQTRRR